MKLLARLERKRWPQREMNWVAEPARVILESGAFASALQIVTQRANPQPLA